MRTRAPSLWALVPAVLAALLASATAAAATRAQVSAVVEAYADLRFDEAKKSADALLLTDANSPEDLAALYRVRGEIAAAEGDAKKALFALERLLALDPAAEPDPEASPKIAEAYYTAKAKWKEFEPFALLHETPKDLDATGELVLTFTLKSDPLDLVKKVVVHYQLAGTGDFKTAEGTGLDEIEVRIPVRAAGAKAVAYYASAVDDHGSAWKSWGDAGTPLVVPRAGFVPVPPPEKGKGKGAGKDALKPPATGKGLGTAGTAAIIIGGVMVASVVAALLIALTR